jgi:hypothetical protein
METLNALGRLNQVPLDMTLEGLRSIGQTQQTDQIGLQELMRKQQFEQSMDPMRMQQQQTLNNQGLANLAKTTRENRENDYTSKARMDAELHKAYASASEADVKGAMARFQQLASSMDPRERQIGITGLQSSKDWLMQKETNDRHLEGIRLQGANQLAVQKEANKGRVELKGMAGAGGGKKDVDWKNPEAAYGALMKEAVKLELAGNDEAALPFRKLAAQQLEVMREKWLSKGVPEGTIDPSKAGGKERPTVPTAPRADVSRPPTKEQAAKEAPKGPTQADLEFTAKKHGLTVEQVKAKLGIK